MSRPEFHQTPNFEPLVARTQTMHRPIGPVAYDCVKLIIVRDGSAIVYSEFGQQSAKIGDLILLGANVLCGSEPEGHITVTTIYADTDYVLDQLFWQYAAVLGDRLAAQGFADEMYSEPAQILRLGEHRAGMLMPWLDEMVRISVDGKYEECFNRIQALWYSVLDVFSPFVRVSPVRSALSSRARAHPVMPQSRRFAPLRDEVRAAAALLEEAPEHVWTLDKLADQVHLSESQFGRVFADAYGLTPLAYQRMLRAKRLAELLRETTLTVEQAMREVGWHSRGHAARLFREHVGLSPAEYRQRARVR